MSPPSVGPLLFGTKFNCLDDGPGIRTVVFFKGCPLRCTWCHNPEGISPKAELAFEPTECDGSQACLRACPNTARLTEAPFVDRDLCGTCFRCAEACPTGALSQVGTPLDLDTLLSDVLRHKPFYDNSGGGVTLSGGEPTWHIDALSSVVVALKDRGVHTLLQTCGAFSLPQLDAKVYPWLDLIYYDLKLHNNDAHREHCGVSNRGILENFAALQARTQVPILPRIPLVPGVTATAENLGALAGFLAGLGVPEVVLLDYNPLWPDKARTLSKTVEGDGQGESERATWMSAAELAACAQVFTDAGVAVRG